MGRLRSAESCVFMVESCIDASSQNSVFFSENSKNAYIENLHLCFVFFLKEKEPKIYLETLREFCFLPIRSYQVSKHCSGFLRYFLKNLAGDQFSNL